MKLRAYIELCRASNLPTVWTNVLAGVVLSGEPHVRNALLAGASTTLTYLGGMALNDVLDVDEDKLNKPERPIPSGRLTVKEAAVFAALLFAAGLALLALCSMKTVLAGVALIAAVASYDSLHKKSALTVLLMASCRALVFVIAALAVSGHVNGWVLTAAAAQFAYIVALTGIARAEKKGAKVPPIPWLLAGVSLVDGVVLAILAAPAWLLAGVAGAATTRLLQTQVRGD